MPLHYYDSGAGGRRCYYGYLRLVVVLHAHSEKVCEDDDGDEEIQVVAGAHGVDGSTPRGVVGVIRFLQGSCIVSKHAVIKMLFKG